MTLSKILTVSSGVTSLVHIASRSGFNRTTFLRNLVLHVTLTNFLMAYVLLKFFHVNDAYNGTTALALEPPLGNEILGLYREMALSSEGYYCTSIFEVVLNESRHRATIAFSYSGNSHPYYSQVDKLRQTRRLFFCTSHIYLRA